MHFQNNQITIQYSFPPTLHSSLVMKPDKSPSFFLYYLSYIVGLVEGVPLKWYQRQEVSSSILITYILLHIIIPAYRSLYDEACVAQISEGGALAGTQ
jgi:hypothetical protein